MTKIKVCLLGAFAVGKTSLVRRRVHGTFSDAYLTTIGVRIDKLALVVDGEALDLVVWDLHGEDRFQSVQAAYMHGASGVLVVADLTRPDTAAVALELERRARAAIGDVPVVRVWTKDDLVEDLVRASAMRSAPAFADAMPTSARTGAGVNEVFERVVRQVRAGGKRHAR